MPSPEAQRTPTVRLSVRTEGQWVVAYLESPGPEREPVEVARAAAGLFRAGATGDQLFERWTALVKEGLRQLVLEARPGAAPLWLPGKS